MAHFPNSIWDGRTATRIDLDAVRPPDHQDWIVLLDELQAVQGYILSLAGNMASMPNLNGEIKEADERLTKLLSELQRLAPPADLHKIVADMQRTVEEIDVRVEHERLKSGVKQLFLRMRHVERTYKDMKREVFHELEVMKNSFRNQLAEANRKSESRFQALKADIAELQDILQNPNLDD